MSTNDGRKITTDQLQLKGGATTINSQLVQVDERDSSGNVTRAHGLVTITDGASGYAKGCLYRDTDVGAGTSGIYENVGTTTSCNFDLIAGGSGVTTFIALSDAPSNYTADANKIVKVNNGETALEFVDVSGDVDMSAAGVMTVSDLTITGEAAGNMLYFNGTNWVRLASGTNLYILQYQTGTNAPVWIDPATLPTGIATGLSSSFTMEGGANDIVHAVTAQTVGSPTLTVPDFANVDDTYAFVTLAQTLANKTLTSPVLTTPQINDTSSDHQYIFAVNELAADRTVTLPLLLGNDTFVFADFIQTLTNKTLTLPKIATTGAIVDAGGDEYVVFTEATTPVTYIGIHSGDTTVAPQLRGEGEANTSLLLAGTGTGNVEIADGADVTKKALFELVGATTAKTMTFTVSHTDNRNLTFPDATDTLVGKATADVLTNKSLDCDGTGNVLTNVNANELDPITPGAAGIYGIPFVIPFTVSNQAAPVNIFNANAPFAFRVIDAYSVGTSASGGTWKLNNGAGGAGTDLHSAVTQAASDTDIDRIVNLDDAAWDIAANGSLSVVPDGGGAMDIMLFITCIRTN